MLSGLFKRLMLRGASFSGAYRKLSWLYRMEDPWNMTSPGEQHRFAQTAEMLARRRRDTARSSNWGPGRATRARSSPG